MNNKKFCVLYLKKAKFTFLTDDNNKIVLFDSIDSAKASVDNIRNEKTHPLCLNHHITIYQYEGSTIVGNGTRY